MRPLAIVCAIIASAGCARAPDPAAPPPQRPPLAAAEPAMAMGAFVKMSDPNAGDYIAGDVLPNDPGAPWRWTGRRPELRFNLPTGGDWVFFAELALAGATLEKTGPVTVSYFINGHILQIQRYAEPGEIHFERAVAPDWLHAGVNSVAIEPDRVYIAPDDGVALGLILKSAGFVR